MAKTASTGYAASGGRVHPGDTVLDAGSGFGNMSKTAVALCGKLTLMLYDPPSAHAGQHIPDVREAAGDGQTGIFEHVPFRDDTFDAVLCGYSLRGRHKPQGCRLRTAPGHQEGRKAGRGGSGQAGQTPWCGRGVSFYLRMVLPRAGAPGGGWPSRPQVRHAVRHVQEVARPTGTLEGILREKYDRVEFEKGMMGGAIMGCRLQIGRRSPVRRTRRQNTRF